MFLLRCAFWLSAVYAAIFVGLPWQAGPRDGALASAARREVGPDAGRPGRATVDRALAAGVAVGMETLCAGRALDCAHDAAGLTALVQTAIAGDPEYTVVSAGGAASRSDAHPAARPAAIDGGAVPLPVPDPRRGGRLTRER